VLHDAYPQVGDDAVRLRYIPFSLKDLAKKWLYSLAVDLVIAWDDFVKAFLKKILPNSQDCPH